MSLKNRRRLARFHVVFVKYYTTIGNVTRFLCGALNKNSYYLYIYIGVCTHRFIYVYILSKEQERLIAKSICTGVTVSTLSH